MKRFRLEDKEEYFPNKISKKELIKTKKVHKFRNIEEKSSKYKKLFVFLMINIREGLCNMHSSSCFLIKLIRFINKNNLWQKKQKKVVVIF